jgi:hypothetical protein
MAESRGAAERARELEAALVRTQEQAAAAEELRAENEALRARAEDLVQQARTRADAAEVTAAQQSGDDSSSLITDLQRKLRAAEMRNAELAQQLDQQLRRPEGDNRPLPLPPQGLGGNTGGTIQIDNHQGGTIIINNGTGGATTGAAGGRGEDPAGKPPAEAPRKRIG